MRPSARPPIDTSGNFPAHVSRVTFKHLQQPLRSHIRSFGNLGQLSNFSKILKVTLQKRVPENFRSCRWGAEWRVSCVQTRERGPPLVCAEIPISFHAYTYTYNISSFQDFCVRIGLWIFSSTSYYRYLATLVNFK